MWPGYWSHEFGIEQHNVRLQPPRLTTPPAAVGCKPCWAAHVSLESLWISTPDCKNQDSFDEVGLGVRVGLT